MLQPQETKPKISYALPDKQGWEPAESVTSTEAPPRRLNNPPVAAMTSDRWDTSERKQQHAEKSKSYSREPVDRPTFRTHQYNKSAQEREKKHSIASTLTTEKADTMEGRKCVYCVVFFGEVLSNRASNRGQFFWRLSLSQLNGKR